MTQEEKDLLTEVTLASRNRESRWVPVPQRDGSIAFARNFEAAESNRLTMDWLTSDQSLDEQLKNSLALLIRRSRSLCQNNEYFHSFLGITVDNVIGHQGMRLNMRIMEGKNNPDEMANEAVTKAWKRWSRPSSCTVHGSLSLRDVFGLCVKAMLRDGAPLLRIYRGSAYGEFAFQIGIFDIDLLDVNYNENLRNGNKVVMGVEINGHRKPVAYHLLERIPNNGYYSSCCKRERVPASDIIHPFVSQRAHQVRGIPAMVSAMRAMKTLGDYRNAELTSAKRDAMLAGFFERSDGSNSPYTGEQQSNGSVTMHLESNVIQDLPAGLTYKPNTALHPNAAFGDFCKEVLRGIASSLGMSYHTFANDPSGVNYSSARVFELAQRERWKSLQVWFIDHVCLPIFENWLQAALMAGAIKTPTGAPLPASKYDKFNAPQFIGKRWAWVDPLKEVNSAAIAIENGLQSHCQVLMEQGLDEDQIIQDEAMRINKLRDQGASDMQAQPERSATRKLDEDEPRIEQSYYARPPIGFVEDIKKDHPEIWRSGGNKRGNDAFKLWKRYIDGDRSDTVIDWVKEREAWAARHFENGAQFIDEEESPTLSNIGGVIAQLKWGVVGRLGMKRTRALIRDLIQKLQKGSDDD